MAPDDNHGRSHAAHQEYAVQMASVLTRLDAIDDAVRELSRHVKEQNGRVGKVETRQAAYDQMALSDVREHKGVDDRMDGMAERLKDLETYRSESVGASVPGKLEDMEARMKDLEGFKREAGGAVKATIGIVRDAMMIFTFLLSAWYMVGERMTHQHAPTQQVQAK